ncbi:hypothetical protein QU41_00180, partial [Bradyrhizobium elkanii]
MPRRPPPGGWRQTPAIISARPGNSAIPHPPDPRRRAPSATMMPHSAVGGRPPTAEWGIMVAEGARLLGSGGWGIALFPGLALMIAGVCLHPPGGGLRGIVDPPRGTGWWARYGGGLPPRRLGWG